MKTEEKESKTIKKSEGPEGLTKPNIVSVGYPLKDFCEQNPKESRCSRVGEKVNGLFKDLRLQRVILTPVTPTEVFDLGGFK